MKLKKFLLLLILPLCFLVVGCKDSSLNEISKNLDSYTMDIVLNDDYTLDVNQTINYTNRTGQDLNNIMLHLYPRSFRQNAKSLVISNINYSTCYYNGAKFGDIEISTLSVDSEEKTITLTGDDEDILDIALSSPLPNGKGTSIALSYTVTIPNINHRFGHGEDTINICNFYPILCMFEDGEFVTDSYHYNGDPFYSAVANYNVTLKANSDLVLASTGEITNKQTTDGITKYQISAKVVRDFAMVLSDKFKVVSDNIDGVNVSYFYYKNQYPSECLQAGLDSISTFNRLFGKYPYSTLSIVESNFVHGGMEYPNLVLISDAVDIQSDYVNVIVHETAHQWWYGIVGNNEYNYGWLDEGLTEYSTVLFYNENPQYNVDTKELIKNTTNSYITFYDLHGKVFGTNDTTMNRALNEYTGETEYVYIAYVKGMLLFDSLHEVLGHDNFIKSLKTYFDENKFGIATPDTLIEAFEHATKTELNSFFESWINGTVKIVSIK